jgi:hypothetical protein
MEQDGQRERSKSFLNMDHILTDAVLLELKNQASEGCLLCSFDALDNQEWE